jgi:hypothetical protein
VSRAGRFLIGAVLGTFTAAVLAVPLVYWLDRPTPTVVPVVKPSPSPSPRVVVHIKGEDRIVALWTKDTLGHACPINATDALTADHVALKDMFINGSEGKFAPFVVWGDELGNTGTAQWQWSDKRRDLSMIRTVPNTPTFSASLRRAVEVPAVGSKVYVVGYDFKTTDPGTGGLGDYTLEATVTGIRAGVLVYSSTPGGGSSGGCVLNNRGEIVAVNVAMIASEGLGLLVVGPWAEVPDAFLDGKR